MSSRRPFLQFVIALLAFVNGVYLLSADLAPVHASVDTCGGVEKPAVTSGQNWQCCEGADPDEWYNANTGCCCNGEAWD